MAADDTAPRSTVSPELVDRVATALGDDVIEATENYADYVVRVKPEAWRHAAEVAEAELACDFLSFVSGIDWAPTPREGDEKSPSAPVQPQETAPGVAGGESRFQVFGHVQSTTRGWGVTFKADLDEAAPAVESWVGVYPGADWHEREAWEMYGIEFSGHPGLRHLYLPAEFEGHPLRKDFPLLARAVKPWPGIVDPEDMPAEAEEEAGDAEAKEEAREEAEEGAKEAPSAGGEDS